MIKEDTTDETTEINWDCYDGTDDSVITVDGVSVNPESQPAQSRVAQIRRESREQLEREQSDSTGVQPSVFDRLLKSFFNQD